MVKYFTCALLFIASAVSAQTFPKPPDVAPYVEVIPQYQAGYVLDNNPIDPNVTPPPQAGLADIPTSQTGRTVASTAQCITLGETGGSCQEAKFRTAANVTGIRYDDPIRNYGQPGTSHCHTFFGNKNANAYSTYQRLRTNSTSWAAGAELNATGYWFPCMKKDNAFGDGKNYAVKASQVIIYYVASDRTQADKTARIANGQRYVFGTNMDDPNLVWLQNIVNAANAQSGTAGRYALSTQKQFDYVCSGATPNSANWLKNANGTEPFNGTCNAGQALYIRVTSSARCWDGVNLWSPGGYRHIIPTIADLTKGKDFCPINYYLQPALNMEILFNHQGFADYGNWRLASDDMAGTLAGRTFNPGESFHTDWMDGWDQATKRGFEDYCVGVLNQVSHECNNSSFTNNLTMISSQPAPNGRSPQIRFETYSTLNPADMWQLPANSNGPDTIHVHGN